MTDEDKSRDLEEEMGTSVISRENYLSNTKQKRVKQKQQEPEQE